MDGPKRAQGGGNRTAGDQHISRASSRAERAGWRCPKLKTTITDASKDIETDADLLDVKDGTTWFLTFGDSGLAAPTRERISFQPHPKTLTMAGDYEYFAAQGRHPFVYALAEFIDNSLRATRRNAPHPATSPSPFQFWALAPLPPRVSFASPTTGAA